MYTSTTITPSSWSYYYVNTYYYSVSTCEPLTIKLSSYAESNKLSNFKSWYKQSNDMDKELNKDQDILTNFW